jgi:hypothetical protein
MKVVGEGRRLAFGDNVRIRATELTSARGLAGLAGQVSPSKTISMSIGAATRGVVCLSRSSQ